MSRLARLPLALGAFLLVLACHGDRAVTPPIGGPTATIQDGTDADGNENFFFLPPLVPDPDTDDPSLSNGGIPPLVVICELVHTDVGTDCSNELIRYTMSSGDGSEVLRYDHAAGHFIVNWHTDHFVLSSASTYRIRVLRAIDEVELGFADVDLVDSGKELKTAIGDIVPLLDGRTLPIKFRIQRGLYCSNTADCAEQVVTNAGGEVVTNTGFAAASFPDDWLPRGLTEVVVVIERVDLSGSGDDVGIDQTRRRCHESSILEEAEGCYNYQTFPDLPEGFNGKKARVEVCIEFPELDPRRGLFQLHKSDQDEATVALDEVPDLLIDCAGFEALASGTAALPSLARRAWHALTNALASVVRPRSLHATALANVGLGGETGSFSNIGWARPAIIEVIQPAGGVTGAPAGAIVTVQVRVANTHPDPDEGVGGETVTFSPQAGTVPGEPPATDDNGYASVSWTLPSSAGTYTLTIAATQVSNSPVHVTATVNRPQGTTLYGVNSSDDGLSTVSLATGTVSLIGRLNASPDSVTTPVAMAARPRDNTLFVWNNSDLVTTGHLFTVDVCTGRGSRVDLSTSPQGALQALAFAPTGSLYGLDGDFFTVDPATGGKTRVATLSQRVAGADFVRDQLYVLTFANNLGTVNTATGALTIVAPLSVDIGTPGSLLYDEAADMLIGTGFGGDLGNILFDVDRATGAVSNIRTVSGGSAPQGLAFGDACPPPN